VWIDADPACEHYHMSDPDDRFAIMALPRAHNIKVGFETIRLKVLPAARID
jgi:hypothetical protein